MRTSGCDYCGTLLAAAIDRLDLVERAQVRALSNGKVRFS